MRLIFITGVSRGLGLALSKVLANDDTRIVGFSRSRGGYEGAFHGADFSKPRLAAGVFDQAFAEAPLAGASSIIFISNAGQLGPLDFIERLDPADIQENLTSNLAGAAVALSHFIKYTHAMDKPKLFVQITSGVAEPRRAKPGWALYNASKAGQNQLIRTVALEQRYARHPAVLISVNPGVMDTAMQKLIRETPKESFPDVDHFIQMKEEGTVSEPEAVAKKILLLIEDLQNLESGGVYNIGTSSPDSNSGNSETHAARERA